VLAFGLVGLADNLDTPARKRVKQRLLSIIVNPHPSVIAFNSRPQELFPLGARVGLRSVDDSFPPKFLLWIAHMVTTIDESHHPTRPLKGYLGAESKTRGTKCRSDADGRPALIYLVVVNMGGVWGPYDVPSQTRSAENSAGNT
jgi:hypothetical protein